jgi:hypothetical protein
MATMPIPPAAPMAAPTAAPMDAAAPAEETTAPETEAAQGYVIEIIVKSDGTFAVSKEMLQEEAMEEDGEAPAATFENLGAALKAVMDMVKANPVGESDQAQFEAGYQE